MSQIDQAFQAVQRADFVPDSLHDWAAIDVPLPIGYGQTISQPTTVRLMLEWLDTRPGDYILDLGSGSGWTTALLAYLVGPEGYVYAVERIPQLVEFGRRNCKQAGITNVRFYQSGTVLGLSEYAPYDCILVGAAAERLPEQLLDQLKPWGKLVIPVKHDILEITKTGDHNYETQTHHGFTFVPLIHLS